MQAPRIIVLSILSSVMLKMRCRDDFSINWEEKTMRPTLKREIVLSARQASPSILNCRAWRRTRHNPWARRCSAQEPLLAGFHSCQGSEGTQQKQNSEFSPILRAPPHAKLHTISPRWAATQSPHNKGPLRKVDGNREMLARGTPANTEQYSGFIIISTPSPFRHTKQRMANHPLLSSSATLDRRHEELCLDQQTALNLYIPRNRRVSLWLVRTVG